MTIINLSHPLTSASPLYPNTPGPVISSHRSITAGDTANTSLLTIHSHTGTHIDAPYHFCQDKTPLSFYLLNNTLITAPVRLIHIPVKPDLIITPDLIAPHLTGLHSIAGLLIKTGFGRYRTESPDTYVMHTPFIHPDVPALLRRCCPSLMLLGIDTISIAHPEQKETGRICHRAFLCDNHPILLIEDMNLARCTTEMNEPFRLTIIPFYTELSDGSPVIVIGSSLRTSVQ